MADLDSTDRALLDLIQTDFPLAPRPYAQLGKALGLTEAETLAKIRALRGRGLIRRIGPSFSSRHLGYVSTLCAARVSADKLEAFVQRVNAEPGVTHNYLRDHDFNVWFTLIAPSGETAEAALKGITEDTGISVLSLPAAKVYKIKVDFPMRGEEKHA